MAVKHVIIGRASKNSAPIPVYAGDFASEGEEAKKNFPRCATFEHFEQLHGVTKRNPDFNPNAPRYIQAWIEEDDAGAGAAAFEAQVAAEVEKATAPLLAEIEELKAKLDPVIPDQSEEEPSAPEAPKAKGKK